jgi:hypothetical protein
MRVTFEVDTPEMSGLSEEILQQLSPEAAAATFGGARNLVGGLVVDDTESRKLASFGDELFGLIGSVCIASVPELAAGRPFTYEFRSDPGELRMIPDGEFIRLETDERSSQFPSLALLPALLDCGERFLRFLGIIHADDPDWTSLLDRLSADIVQARALIS